MTAGLFERDRTSKSVRHHVLQIDRKRLYAKESSAVQSLEDLLTFRSH
jgi:hypothetical protein